MSTRPNPVKTVLRAAIATEPLQPTRLRTRQLDVLEQIEQAVIEGTDVLIPSKRIEWIVYRVTAKGCSCIGNRQHQHCYHEGLRKTVLWLMKWLPFEKLTLAQAVANLRKAKRGGGCGAVDCVFCRRLDLCPRTARSGDWKAVQNG
jgi:hypothetical protein